MKKVFLVLLLLITLLMLNGCTDSSDQSDSLGSDFQDIIDQSVSSCSDIEDVGERDFCYRELAEKSKNASICDMMESDPEQCYLSTATLADDLEACEKLKDEFNKIKCYNTVGIGTKNPSACQKIKDKDIYPPPRIYREGCYRQIASDTMNASLCENIAEYITRCAGTPPECIDIISKSPRTVCIAVATRNESLCETINDDSGLKSDCYTYLGWAKGDICQYCDKIGSSSVGVFYCRTGCE